MALTAVEEDIRATLITRARSGIVAAAVLTYKELGEEWDPDHAQEGTTPRSRPPFRGLPKALGNILRHEHAEGRPLLTGIVVQQATGLPGSRFAELVRELGVTIPEDEEAWWSSEVDRTISYWSQESKERSKGRLKELTLTAVTAALDEYDQLGREAFLTKYGYGEAKGLFVVHDAKQYDSKAIAGVAMGYLPNRKAWAYDDFSGGVASVVPVLEGLGFQVIDTRPKKNPRWSVEEVILALDVYLQHGLLDDTDPIVVQLSEDLNALEVHEQRPDESRWRNANSASLKLSNLAHFDPGYPGVGMRGGSKLDGILLQRLSPYPDLVARIAYEVRNGARFDLEDLPKGDVASQEPLSNPAPSGKITSTFGSVEQHHAKGGFTVHRTVEEVQAARVEQPLVIRFCQFVEKHGYGSGRRTYRLDGVDYPCDVVLPDVNLLIEAKSRVSRTYLRMAVGQLKDYDFMHAEETGAGYDAWAVLLRGRPTDSAIRFLQRERVGAIWAVNDAWAASPGIRERLSKCDWTE